MTHRSAPWSRMLLAVAACVASTAPAKDPIRTGLLANPASREDLAREEDDRKRHVLRQTRSGGRVRDPAFTADFGRAGLSFTPWGGTDIQLRTRSVTCGERIASSTRAAWVLEGHRASRALRGNAGIREAGAVTLRGIRFEWTIPKPDTPCTLEVQLRVRGARPARLDPNGHALEEPRSGRAVARVSRPLLRDPRNGDVSLESSSTAETITITVDAQTLAAAPDPVVAHIELTPELEVLPRSVGGPRAQLKVDVAFDGKQYLAVWQDGQRVATIHAARVTRDGRLLDPDSFTLSSFESKSVDERPAVAGIDGTFLVVWQSGGADRTLEFARVRGSDGKVLESSPLLPPRSDFYGGGVAIAGGKHFLVVWNERGAFRVSPGRLRALRMRRDGRILDDEPIELGTDLGVEPAVSYSGGTFVVAWRDGNRDVRDPAFEIRVARIRESDGEVLDPGGVVVSRRPKLYEHPPAISATGDIALVAWALGGYYKGHVFGRRLRISTGEVLEEQPTLIGPGYRKRADEVSLAARNGVFLLAYQGSGRSPVWVTRIEAESFALEAVEGSLLERDSAAGLALAAGTNGWLLGWVDRSKLRERDVSLGLLSSDGRKRVGEAHRMFGGIGHQYGRRLSAADGRILVIVDDGAYRRSQLLRLGADGRVLGRPLTFQEPWASAGLSGTRIYGVSSSGADWLVTWRTNEGSMQAVRVDVGTGRLLDRGVSLGTARSPQNRIGAAFDGTHHVVAWADLDEDRTGTVYLARVRATDGRPTEPVPYPVANVEAGATAVSVAASSVGVAVSWFDGVASPGWRNAIARVAVVQGSEVNVQRLVVNHSSGLPELLPRGAAFGAMVPDVRVRGLSLSYAPISLDGNTIEPTVEFSNRLAVGRVHVAPIGREAFVCWTDDSGDEVVRCARLDAEGNLDGGNGAVGVPVVRGVTATDITALDDDSLVLLYDRTREGASRAAVRVVYLPRLPRRASPTPLAPKLPEPVYPPPGEYRERCRDVQIDMPLELDAKGRALFQAIVEEVACPAVVQCARYVRAEKGSVSGQVEFAFLITFDGSIVNPKVKVVPNAHPLFQSCVRLGLVGSKVSYKPEESGFIEMSFSIPQIHEDEP